MCYKPRNSYKTVALQQKGCFATEGLLCNKRVALQQKGCFATKVLLCNKRVALQQKCCFATIKQTKKIPV